MKKSQHPSFTHHPIAFAILCSVSATAWAQTDAPADEPTITIIAEKGTSATKTSTKIKDIPQAISAVSKTEIRNRAVNGVDEAVQKVAGVTSAAYGADPRTDWLLVRGFNPSRYLDGMPLPNGTWTGDSRIEPYGLEQIEVLKGPSSVMYGQIPPGGMVNMISKRPTDELIREIEVQYGSNKHKQLAADFAGAFDPAQTVQYRFTGLIKDGDAVVDHAKDKRYFFAPSLKWNISDKTSLTLLGRYQKSKTALAGGFLPMEGTLTSNPNGRISKRLFTGEPGYDNYDKESMSIGYELEHKFSDKTAFRQNLRYAKSEVDHQSVGTLGFIPGSQRILSRYVYPLEESSKSFTIDNQLTTKFNTGAVKHNVIAGFDYRDGKNDYASGFGFGVGTLDAFNPVYGSAVVTPDYNYHQIQKQKQYGLYAQDEMSYDKWRFTLGARHDWADTTTTDRMTNKTSKQKDSAWSTRAAVGYAFNDDLTAYTAFSTSFQPTIGTTFNGSAFKPSKGRQVEVGLKYQPTRHTLITAALYDMTQSNISVVDPDHIFFSIQQGKIRVKGAELEAKVRINRNLSLDASYTYTNAKISKTTDATLLNTQVPLVSRHQASFGATYDFKEGTLKGLSLNGAVRFTGKHYGAAGDKLQTPGYAVFDAGVGYQWDKWKVQLNASNLFNRRYVSTCNQTFWCYYGQPRNITLTARMNF